MATATAVGLLLAAAVLLASGAELFAEHAVAAGRRLGVSALAIGVLLAGAEPEELVTAVIATVRGQPAIAGGDAIGANVTLLTLILGSLAVASPLTLARRGAQYAAGATIAGLAAWLTLLDDRVGRPEGAALVVVYAALVAAVWWREREPPAIGELGEALEEGGHDDESAGTGLLLAILGVALMGGGGWAAVEGAQRVVELLDVSGSVVGLTIVALATTSEFIALIPAALRRGVPELAAAGIVGSVIYNATVTLGVAALSRPVQATGLRASAGAAVLLAGATSVVAWRHGRVGRVLGTGLIAAYGLYVWILWA